MKENKKLFIVFIIAAFVTFIFSIFFNKINQSFWENIFIGLFTSSIISVITSYLIYRLNYKQELNKIMQKTFNLATNLEKIGNYCENFNLKEEKLLSNKIKRIYLDCTYISNCVDNLSFLLNYKERKRLKVIQNFSTSIYNVIQLDYKYLEKSRNDNKRILLLKILLSLKEIPYDSKFIKACSKITIKNDYLDLLFKEYLNSSDDTNLKPLNQYLKDFKKEHANLLKNS